MKKLVVLLLALVLTLCGPIGCGKAHDASPAAPVSTDAPATPEPPPTPERLIEEIITFHGCYGDRADDKVAELLEQLTASDSRQGALWRDIMDYWRYANTRLEVNLETLPEDLPQDDSLCLVVLGYELNADGTMQDELIGRLTVAEACARQYPNAVVICTGGGTAKDEPDATEAGQMGAWLLEHGLEESRLIIEDRSLTTAQNAEFSYDILLREHPRVDSVVLISSSYHIPWGSLLFEASFMKSASEWHTPEIHVVSNCAWPTENEIYKSSEILRWETGGMLQLIGRDELAMDYYYDHYEKPEL